MDTVTQITLGAAIGEAVLGKKIGNKAPLWGAFFGVVPDLDVLASPFISEVQALAVHRGITHSLFFSVVAALFFGWVIHRYRKKENVSQWEWSAMVFGALITHIFVDVCTSYGTQVLQPFSNYSLSFNSIFIIDPFYTFPLAAGILTALFMKRNSTGRLWANFLGLAVSSLYLIAGFGIKSHVDAVFQENFAQQQIQPDQYMTTSMPLTQFLWVAYARTGDTVHAGLYSIFDDDRSVTFHQIDRNSQLVEPYFGDEAMDRILWFSRGYFTAEKRDGGLYMYDLRFGRSDLWLSSEPAPMVWSYRLELNPDATRATGFSQPEPGFDFSRNQFQKLIDRISGQE